MDGHSQVKSEGAQLLDKAHRAALKTEAATGGGTRWGPPRDLPGTPRDPTGTQGTAPRAAESAGARAASEGAVGDRLRSKAQIQHRIA